jgi:hypothetical protein
MAVRLAAGNWEREESRVAGPPWQNPLPLFVLESTPERALQLPGEEMRLTNALQFWRFNARTGKHSGEKNGSTPKIPISGEYSVAVKRNSRVLMSAF